MSMATINIDGKIYNVPYEVAEEIRRLNMENEELKAVVLLAPGSNEEDFSVKYRKWWDTYYREIRTPGCNVYTVRQALMKEEEIERYGISLENFTKVKK
jgi:hypothetical protein